VRHTNDKGASTVLHCRIDAELEAWDEGLAAFQAKPFHRVKLAGHEGTPLVRPVQSLVHVTPFFVRGLSELKRFKLLPNPITNLAILNVHELDANFVAISMSVGFDEIAEHPLLFALHNGASEGHLDMELTIHIRLCESVAGGVEQTEQLLVGEVELFGETWAIFVNFFELEWVNIGHEVPMSHEGAKQHLQSSKVIGMPRLFCAAHLPRLILQS